MGVDASSPPHPPGSALTMCLWVRGQACLLNPLCDHPRATVSLLAWHHLLHSHPPRPWALRGRRYPPGHGWLWPSSTGCSAQQHCAPGSPPCSPLSPVLGPPGSLRHGTLRLYPWLPLLPGKSCARTWLRIGALGVIESPGQECGSPAWTGTVQQGSQNLLGHPSTSIPGKFYSLHEEAQVRKLGGIFLTAKF